MGADEGDVVLPIELASFTSQINNTNVILKWTTTTEKNNSGFEIQRRRPENEWTIIGFVEGAGSSGSPKDYTFTDMNLNSGKYNYRLKQTDLNGEFKYYTLANEVTIAVPEKYSLSQNYPNPFNPVTNLKYGIPYQGFVSLKVYDILGNEVRTLVNETKTAGSYSVTFDAADLSSGIYF
ncbi:MAG: T9SS type A sorting domain-containing protein [Ignavibacteria bacterium]|nr:T9SS type A sorting domain-containing protein [Ignavibacteria bacterium]